MVTKAKTDAMALENAVLEALERAKQNGLVAVWAPGEGDPNPKGFSPTEGRNLVSLYAGVWPMVSGPASPSAVGRAINRLADEGKVVMRFLVTTKVDPLVVVSLRGAAAS